jgi:GTP-binding nuclear protein Ran
MQYKLLLVGDGGCGKTTWLQKYISGILEKRYLATLGVEVTPVKYKNVEFSVWDCAGQEKFGGLKDMYYTGADAAIIFYDVTSKITKNNVAFWTKEIRNKCPAIPIIVCGTKNDLEPKDQFPDSNFNCTLSSKNGHNLNQPFKLVVDALHI